MQGREDGVVRLGLRDLPAGRPPRYIGTPDRHDGPRGPSMWNASEVEDQRTIRQLVENWAVWRDALMWDRFRTVWHDDGRMMATWFQGTADEFIKVSQQGYERGVRILHFLGGTSIEIADK